MAGHAAAVPTEQLRSRPLAVGTRPLDRHRRLGFIGPQQIHYGRAMPPNKLRPVKDGAIPITCHLEAAAIGEVDEHTEVLCANQHSSHRLL